VDWSLVGEKNGKKIGNQLNIVVKHVEQENKQPNLV